MFHMSADPAALNVLHVVDSLERGGLELSVAGVAQAREPLVAVALESLPRKPVTEPESAGTGMPNTMVAGVAR